MCCDIYWLRFHFSPSTREKIKAVQRFFECRKAAVSYYAGPCTAEEGEVVQSKQKSQSPSHI